MWVHGICMVCVLLNRLLKSMCRGKFEFVRMMVQLLKTMLYFFTMLYVQCKLITVLSLPQNGGYMIARNYMEVLLIYDVAFFYFTVFALILFNLTIRCFRFHTIRERMVGPIERFKHLRGDSLYISREDVFWVTVPIARIGLWILINVNRYSGFVGSKPVRFCILGMNLVNLYVVWQIFFASSQNNFIKNTNNYRWYKVPILFIVYAIIFGFEVSLLSLMKGTKFWGPLGFLDMTL